MAATGTWRGAVAQVLAAWKQRAENPLVVYGMLVEQRWQQRYSRWQLFLRRHLMWVTALLLWGGILYNAALVQSQGYASDYPEPGPFIDTLIQPFILFIALLMLAYSLPKMLYWIYALPVKVVRFIMGQRGGRDWLAFDESLALSHLTPAEVLVAAVRLYFVPLFIWSAGVNAGYWLLVLGMPPEAERLWQGLFFWEHVDYDNYINMLVFTPLVIAVQVVSTALSTLFYGLWMAALARGLKAPVVHGGAGLFYVLSYLLYLLVTLFFFSVLTSNGVEGFGYEEAGAFVVWGLLVNGVILLLAWMLMRISRYWMFAARLAVGIWPLVFVGIIGVVFLADSWRADWFEYYISAAMHGLCSLTLLNPLAIPAVAVDPDAWGAFIAIPLSGFRLPFAVVLQLAASAVALNYALKGIALRRREFTE